jgi:hypothetical protein
MVFSAVFTPRLKHDSSKVSGLFKSVVLVADMVLLPRPLAEVNEITTKENCHETAY